MIFFTFSIKWIRIGVGYFNKPGREVDYYFYGENGLEVAFCSTLQNCKPQKPNSGK